MIYEFDSELVEIKINEINESKITVGYITLQELEKYYKELGFSESTFIECTLHSGNFRSDMDVYDKYSFGLMNIIDVNNIFGARDRLGYYLKKNLFLVVDVMDADNSTKELFEYSIQKFQAANMTLEKVMYSFFDRLLYKDNKALEDLEFKISSMEDEVESGGCGKEFNSRILHLKKKLLILRNYYEQLIDIGEQLQENSNDLFEEEELRYFKIFTDKVTRLSSNTQILRENLVQLREAYQATLDYSLNSIMKVFTVVTTIFLPLTLIVGWYGMNFTTMPELTWKFGYIFVIALSLLVIALCILFFKKKKLL